MKKLEVDFVKFYKKHTKITPVFFIEEADYLNYPINEFNRIPSSHLANVAKDVHKRYSGEGTDHIVMLIHEDNWKMAGIWGTNWSNIYYGYMFQLCRFDKNNNVNSFGTLYHEVHHSHDALIYTYLNIKIGKLLNVFDWDDSITHGGKYKGGDFGYKYIRYQENTSSLEYIAPLLMTAYAKRQAIYDKKIGMMKQVIKLLSKVLVLIRQQVTNKRI